MKITYMRLKNFAGIYAGMGIKDIEIKKFNDINKIIMLVGQNGSGKTVILSSLNVFREGHDERKNIIIKGEKGYKEIHLQDGNNEYIMKHFYGNNSSQNKSFISKNGVELNENGGIKLFDQLIYDELKLTKDYFKIGKLGSNVTNFMDLKTTERKTYINKFIPSIDDYLEAFEITKSKFNKISKDLKELSSKISKYDDIEVLRDTRNTIYKSINTIESNVNNIKSNISMSEGKIQILKDNISDITLSPVEYMSEINNDISICESKIQQFNLNISEIYIKYPKLKEYSLENMTEVIHESEKNSNNIDNFINNLNDDLKRIYNDNISITNKIYSLNNKINAINTIDVESLQEDIDVKEKLISSRESIINNDIVEEWNEYSIIEINGMKSSINNLLDIIQDLNASTRLDVINNYDRYVDYGSMLKEITNNESLIKNEINKSTNKYNTIDSKKDLLVILEKRPSECKIDGCAFIKNSVDYKNNEYSQLNTIHDEINKLNKELSLVVKEKEEIELYYDYHINLNKVVTYFNNKIHNKIKSISSNIYEIAKMNIMNIQELFNIDAVITNMTNFNEIQKDKERLLSSKEQLKNAIQNKEIYLMIQDEINSYKDNISQLEKDNIEKKGLLDDYNRQSKISKSKITILKTLLDSLSLCDENSTKLKNLLSTRETINSTFNDIISLEEFIKVNKLELDNVIKNELIPFKSRLTNIDKDITVIEDTMENLAIIESKYDDYRLIKESLDPKSGIPLLFIDNYLKDISVRANELLTTAYGGKFKIKFDITESDFFISVYKSDGTVLTDIKEASQGEVSLTNISLSLAMIEKMVEKYNIIYLDEIDATLSPQNRRLFIDLLETQINKLNIEQVFLISHNDEFNSYGVDLILTKDPMIDIRDKEFMQNKNVLYKF